MKRPPYLDLWLLLAVALTFFVGISLAEEDFSLGAYKLKKAPFREQLLAEKSASSESSDYSNSSDNSDPSAPADSIPVDTEPQTFLIFGDSMTPNLARRLAYYAGYNGHNAVHSVNWDSSTSVSWAESDRIEEFITKYQPTFIFVCLGSNESFMKNPSVRQAKIQSIVDKFGDIPYVWIGPPSFGEQSAYNEMLSRLLGERHYFRSDDLELQRGDDNIHPVQSGSNLWMDAVMRWLPRSAHPFMAMLPEADATPARLTYDSFGPPRKSIPNPSEFSEPSDTSDTSDFPEAPEIPAQPNELPDSCAE